MRNLIKSILSGVVVLYSASLLAQQDTTNTGAIDTERLIIVKPYSPTVSDAVKPKQSPTREEHADVERKSVSYNIFSVPVASTFKPDKGSAKALQKSKAPDLYNTYVALGLGNYFNAFAELYSTIEVNQNQSLILGLNHHSSQGGINGLRFDNSDKFYNTRANIGFHAQEDYYYWGVNVELLHQLYNWYGAFTPTPVDENSAHLKPKHNYTGVFLDGELIFDEMIFDKIDLHYHHFADDFHGKEDHLKVAPRFVFPTNDNNISVDLFGEYLNGAFGHALINTESYGWFNAGVRPSYNYDYGPFSFSLGAELIYSADTKHEKNKIHFYPKVKASYDLAEDYLKLYAGVDGDLDQNDYYKFTQKNPFLAPDLAIAPTNTNYNIFAGVKGRLSEGLHYDIRANYKSQKDKALFSANPGILSYPDLYNGGTLNSSFKWNRYDTFSVLYDDVRTVALQGSLDYTFSNQFSMAVKAAVYDYDAKSMKKAWNLPNLEATYLVDYNISDRWSIGADFFYVGKRHDFLDFQNTLTQQVGVDGYFDANFRLNYQISDQFGLFANGNNLFNDRYDRWYGYEVQGIQLLLGLEIQF